MSWQAYVDTSLVATGEIDKAAIFNVEGTSVWATSPEFNVKPEEIKAVVASYSDTGDIKKIQSNGFHVAGMKYMTIKTDERSVYGMKGKEGICIVKTKQAILVAHYPAGVIAGNAAKIVEQLADYLIGVGY